MPGISALLPRVVSSVGRDLLDVFEFQRAATDLLGAEVAVFSDGALRNEHVSPDLVTATPL
jgi:hypothetical protein